jgi:hypothetical protein
MAKLTQEQSSWICISKRLAYAVAWATQWPRLAYAVARAMKLELRDAERHARGHEEEEGEEGQHILGRNRHPIVIPSAWNNRWWSCGKSLRIATVTCTCPCYYPQAIARRIWPGELGWLWAAVFVLLAAAWVAVGLWLLITNRGQVPQTWQEWMAPASVFVVGALALFVLRYHLRRAYTSAHCVPAA